LRKNDNANSKEKVKKMKLNKIFFVLILTIPFSIYAQYLGGNGRGDVSIILTNVPLPVEEAASSLPTKVELAQNYPNPFNPSTSIMYTVGMRQFVKIRVYDLLGREVAALVNEEKPVGNYKINFNATGLPSGLYFYTLTTNNFSKTRKMILLK